MFDDWTSTVLGLGYHSLVTRNAFGNFPPWKIHARFNVLSKIFQKTDSVDSGFLTTIDANSKDQLSNKGVHVWLVNRSKNLYKFKERCRGTLSVLLFMGTSGLYCAQYIYKKKHPVTSTWICCRHPGDTCRQSVDILWTAYRQIVNSLWISYGHPVDISCTSFLHPVYILWICCGHPIDNLCIFWGHRLDSLCAFCAYPVDSLWTACVYSMHILWTACGQPVDTLWTGFGEALYTLWTSSGQALDRLCTSCGHPFHTPWIFSVHPADILCSHCGQPLYRFGIL